LGYGIFYFVTLQIKTKIMPSCNWAFGCAIGLFVITLIIILVIILGGSNDDTNENIVILPPAPSPAPAKLNALDTRAAALDGAMHNESAHRMNTGSIVELHSAAEAVKLLKGPKPAAVLFYANFCGHCKKMMPDFEQAAHEAMSKTGIVIGRVEAGALKDMASVSSEIPKVTGFPSLLTNEDGIKAHVGRKERAAIDQLLSAVSNSVSNSVSNKRPGNHMRAAAGTVNPGSGSLCNANNTASSSTTLVKPVRAEESVETEDDKKKKSKTRKMVEYDNMNDVCNDLQGKEKVIVMAYADWCGYCKAMKPDFEALLEKAPKHVKVGRINDNVITMLESCTGKNGTVDVIRAYPTILYSDGKKITKVMGRQSLQALLDIVHEKKSQ
jgi:thiol-disulfide isomerase/thioredoxin